MRLFLTLLVITGLTPALNAQSFLSATLITQNSDTLPGYVRADYTPDLVRFKRSLTQTPVNYDISSINGLLVEGLVYQRKVIDGEKVLMQRLVSGTGSLFVLRRKPFHKNRYFLEKGDVFVELIRRSSEVATNGRLYVETYQNHLALFSKILSDCNEFNNQRWPTGFNEESFISLVSAYNQCVQNENKGSPRNVVSPATKVFPNRWFINAGAGLLGSPTNKVRSSLDHYTAKFQDPLLGGYVSLDDQASKPKSNYFATISAGFERAKLSNTNTWGGLLSLSNISYSHTINSQGIVNYYPNDYGFIDPSGVTHNYLPPPLEDQPMKFEGESQEKSSVVQADLFVRHYWMKDHGSIYFGTGAGFGFISSTFKAPVNVYLRDGRVTRG